MYMNEKLKTVNTVGYRIQ